MPFVWNQQVTDYRADVFESPTISYDRSLRLTLGNGDSVSVQFPPTAPSDFVTISGTFHTVQFDNHKFDEIYHMLQTEKPVYFTAYDTEGSNPIRFAGFSTGSESIGEGFADKS